VSEERGWAGHGRARRGVDRGRAGRGVAWQGVDFFSNSQGFPMAKTTLYFGGVPTDPDVKRIRDQWPDANLQSGQQIECGEVARAFGESTESTRFRTVTGRWRKLVERSVGLVIRKRGDYFVVLKDGEVVNSNESDIRSAVKKTRRAGIRSTRVNVKNLSEDEQKRHDLHVKLTGKLLAVANIRNGSPALPKME
jgi:hypothetical protein